jgi:hypothetical protein
MDSSSTINRTIRLPRWAADIIGNPPRSGEGFHSWLFRAALALWKCGRNEDEIYAILENAAVICGRYVQQREIQDAIRNSYATGLRPATSRSRSWPAVNHEQREAIITTGGGLVDVWEKSPIHIEDNNPRTEAIIDLLLPGDPLLCCGKSNTNFDTKRRQEWRGQLQALQFIVPSAMSAATGLTQNGRESKHSLSNTGPRRFLVVEFDTGAADDHAALLLHLAERAPLALAVHSGGKSLHGWFYCKDQSEPRLEHFMRYAVSLGADAATWTRCQFVRMPDGLRDNGKRQVVYFFNPGVLK